MKVGKFIEEYLSSCDDNIVCLHSPDGHSGTTFAIYEWRTERTDEPICKSYLDYEVSQIRAEVENYHYNLAVVIHISTEYPYEESK